MQYDDSISVNKVLTLLETSFLTDDGSRIRLSTTNFKDEFDLIDVKSKVVVEVKSRTNKKMTYPTTIVGYNKILKGLDYIDKGYIVLFVFEFIDGIFYYPLETNHNLEIRLGGRTDRGRREIKDYAYIPINKLIELS